MSGLPQKSIPSGLLLADSPQTSDELLIVQGGVIKTVQIGNLPGSGAPVSTPAQVGLGNVPNVDARARSTHTGTQSADTLTDGTTNKAYTATEKTKLAGVATGATANSPDATLLNRANHTGETPASAIGGFAAAVGGAVLPGNAATLSSRLGALEGNPIVTPPTISTPVVLNITASSAQITVVTSRPTRVVAVYSAGSVAVTTTDPPTPEGLAHSIFLTGLPSQIQHSAFIRATETSTGLVVDSPIFTFTTAAINVSTGPIITQVAANPRDTGATILWVTNEPANGQVEFSTTSDFALIQKTAQYGEMITQHTAEMDGLLAGTLYYYRIKSRNAGDLITTSSTYQMTTTGGVVAITDSFNTTDRTLWPTDVVPTPGVGDATVTVANGVLIATLGTTIGGNGRISKVVDLTNSEAIIEVLGTYQGSSGGPRTVWSARKAGDGNYEIGLFVDNLSIVGFHRVAGVETINWGAAQSYDPNAHVKWRIWIDSTTNNFIVDTAPDAAFASPVVLLTIPVATVIGSGGGAWNVAQSEMVAEVGTYAANTWTGAGRFDNFLLRPRAGSGTPGSGGTTGSYMPTTDPTGWTRIFTEDFITPVPLGSFPGSQYGSKWSVYPYDWPDSSRNGRYHPARVFEVKNVANANGVLDYWLHWDSQLGQFLVGAPLPILPGGSDKSSLAWEVRFRVDTMPGFKMAWLTWPQSGVWPRDGEIDFPEGDFSQGAALEGFMHRQNGANGGDQDYRDTGHDMTEPVWHTCRTEWIGNTSCKFFYNGVQVGATITSRVPNTPMHLVFQCETTLAGYRPSTSTQGHVQLDYAIVWTR